MDVDTCLSLIELKLQMPALSVPQLIGQINWQNRLSPSIVLNNSTVYRFLHQQNLIHPQVNRPVDRRKFDAELPNDLWRSDVMHGPKVDINGKMRKSYLIAILDDHSRLIAHGRFYRSEALSSYLDALENAMAKEGFTWDQVFEFRKDRESLRSDLLMNSSAYQLAPQSKSNQNSVGKNLNVIYGWR